MSKIDAGKGIDRLAAQLKHGDISITLPYFSMS